MKSLKQICEDNINHSIYEVSILADIDDQINAYDDSIIDRIEKWIKENYEFTGLKISDNPNKDGLYEVSAYHVRVKNKNIISLINGMFEWVKVESFNCANCTKLESLVGAPQKVKNWFECYDCASLKSLEGAPQKVGESFDCSKCASLTSLKGAPRDIGRSFSCHGCTKLESLMGAPKKVEGDFYCYNCNSLTSLEGAPKKVGGNFNCCDCENLSSLKGAPKEIGTNFYCYECKTEFTEDDVRKVSDVKGEIVVK